MSMFTARLANTSKNEDALPLWLVWMGTIFHFLLGGGSTALQYIYWNELTFYNWSFLVSNLLYEFISMIFFFFLFGFIRADHCLKHRGLGYGNSLYSIFVPGMLWFFGMSILGYQTIDMHKYEALWGWALAITIVNFLRILLGCGMFYQLGISSLRSGFRGEEEEVESDDENED
jgi:hypothetical protein